MLQKKLKDNNYFAAMTQQAQSLLLRLFKKNADDLLAPRAKEKKVDPAIELATIKSPELKYDENDKEVTPTPKLSETELHAKLLAHNTKALTLAVNDHPECKKWPSDVKEKFIEALAEKLTNLRVGFGLEETPTPQHLYTPSAKH